MTSCVIALPKENRRLPCGNRLFLVVFCLFGVLGDRGIGQSYRFVNGQGESNALTLRFQSRRLINGVKHIVFGPIEAPVYRVENKYRMRIIVKCVLNRESRALFSSLLASYHSNSPVKPTLSIDFNPSSL